MQSNFRAHFGRSLDYATWRENGAGRRQALRTKHCDGAPTEEVNAEQRGGKYKKAPDLVRYATRPGAGVISLGGNQARTNKQYSGQSWRLRGRGECRATPRRAGNLKASFPISISV